MFDSLGRMKNVIEGEDIPLSDCAPSLARAVSVFAPFAGVSPADYGQAQIDAAYQAADIVEEDALVRNIAAEMLRGVSSAWLDGSELCGMEKPQVNILVRPGRLTSCSQSSRRPTPKARYRGTHSGVC